MVFKDHLKGVGTVVLLNIALFAPYFNAKIFPLFALDKFVVLFCLSLIAATLLSRAVFCLVAALVLFTNVIYLHLMAHWPGDFESRVSLALESPPSERWEYLSNYLSGIDALILLYVLACLVGVGLIVRLRPSSTMLLRIAALVPVAAALSLASSNGRAMRLPLITLPQEVYEQPLRARRLAERNSYVASLNLSDKRCAADYRNVVVVIGESSSADHNALYGYSRAGVSKLEGTGMVRFAAIAPSNQTRYSVPMMLTRATPDTFGAFYVEPSLVSELKACGYHTYWVSNQPKAGKYDDNITSLSREADISLFLMDSDEGRDHYDEDLIEKINLINAKDPQKKAFFVHLAGSHVDYNKKFPASFAPKSDNLMEAYDTTVRYTDQVLRGIFDEFPKEGLLFLYASDHGELFTDELFGHGYVPSYQNEYRVPFLVWSSDPERLDQLLDYVGARAINTQSFDDVARFLMGMDGDLKTVSFSRLVLDASSSVVDYDRLANSNMDVSHSMRVSISTNE